VLAGLSLIAAINRGVAVIEALMYEDNSLFVDRTLSGLVNSFICPDR
jgi:hypothetical protein